ncbi:MAG TPA: alpha/beta hydrolase fold domain-containing protein [Solirubrobacteraceae bacterium]|nr:alpha/beta hydrolase fold domain-containing protein [Solirubrobacteraceae bacterium]
MTLLADLRLRFGPTRLPARVYLPAPSAVPAAGAPLVLWLAGRGARDVLCQDLSAAAAAVVIELGCRDGGCTAGYEIEALGWAAEHAPELGASSGPVAVAGQLAGAARAARLAVDAHESGWPVVRAQVLVRPAFSDLCPAPSAVAGAAPATIVTGGGRQDDGRRYAATLRDAGVEVRALVSDARRSLPLHELARALQ